MMMMMLKRYLQPTKERITARIIPKMLTRTWASRPRWGTRTTILYFKNNQAPRPKDNIRELNSELCMWRQTTATDRRICVIGRKRRRSSRGPSSASAPWWHRPQMITLRGTDVTPDLYQVQQVPWPSLAKSSDVTVIKHDPIEQN